MDFDRPDAGAPPVPPPQSPRRRDFLARGAAASLAAAGAPAVAAVADQLPPAIPQWMREPGAGFLQPPYGLPSPFEKAVVRKLPDQPAAFPTATRTPL